MKKPYLLFALLSSAVAGCTPARLVQLDPPPASEQAELLVYREAALNAAGAGMIVGSDQGDYAALSNNQYVRILLRPGAYNVFVRTTQGDQPYKVPLSLAAHEKRCLKAYANPANFGKALVPFTYYLGSTFLLEAADCPSEAALAKYSPVQVEYKAVGQAPN